MAQTTMVNFRMDKDLKENMEKTCKEMGLTMTTAFTIFAAKVAKERRIPFEITADPFYSEINMAYVKKSVQELREGKGTAHELIEVEDE